MSGNFIVKDSTVTVEAANPKIQILAANGDTAIVDVRDLTGVSIYLNQIIDDGNVTLSVSKSIDGTNWAPVASKVQSDFAAGANVALELTLSDANGMPLQARQVKVVVSNKTGNGNYTMTAAGSQRTGWR